MTTARPTPDDVELREQIARALCSIEHYGGDSYIEGARDAANAIRAALTSDRAATEGGGDRG